MQARPARVHHAIGVVAVAATALVAAAAGTSAASPSGASRRPAAEPPSFANKVLASGAKLEHSTPTGAEPLTQPDDITTMGGNIFVAFQNGVGPQGEASATGNRDSTIVEYDLQGHAARQWDILGKCDGLTADPATHQLIATVNEDAHSSVYLIDTAAGGPPVHFAYGEPLPHNGGTDAISLYGGRILISASAPGTSGAPAPDAAYPALYSVTFDSSTRVASVQAVVYDESQATSANGPDEGDKVRLGLTDPDSNEDVPSWAPRFGGDFMLTSQGDKEQIFVHDLGAPSQSLEVLKLSDSVDDTVWAADEAGAIYTTDNSNDTVDEIHGPFTRGSVYVADTPCDANGAPSACPGPGFSANYLGTLNPNTGAITRIELRGPAVAPQGMLFVP